jgi:hypothetical protein
MRCEYFIGLGKIVAYLVRIQRSPEPDNTLKK